MIRLLYNVLILIVFLSLGSSAFAFNAAQYFDKQCSSCHTVGFGDDIGPDLKGVLSRRTEGWLIPFIQSSQDVINAGDPVANELFNKYRKKKMPDQNLSKSDIKKLLQFIAKGGPGEKPLKAKSATKATPAEIALGQKLFLGDVALKEGGPACISCHSVGDLGPLGGGTLGPNLSQVYSKYEDKGLSKALAKTGFPVMRAVYEDKQLTEQEAYALKSFLFKADQKGYIGKNFQKKFLFLGLGGGILAMGVIDFTWRKRRKKTVKPKRGGMS